MVVVVVWKGKQYLSWFWFNVSRPICHFTIGLSILFILIYALIHVEKKKVLVFTLCITPTAFKMLESSSQKFLQGLVYLIGNLMGLALAVYKCQSMGLLPTHASDWLAFIEPPEVRQKKC